MLPSKKRVMADGAAWLTLARRLVDVDKLANFMPINMGMGEWSDALEECK